jgi:transaldolase
VQELANAQLHVVNKTVKEDEQTMRATALLRDFGQSLWLDNITRDLLNNGTLEHYINDLSITGLTSNPTIFDHAVKNSTAYDAEILEGLRKGGFADSLFFDLALQDITRAADLFRTAHDRTNGIDGWVSLEVPPSLAHDATSTLAAAKVLFARAARPNVFIKIPGTQEGLAAIEEAIFAGVPINVTLLFSAQQYLAAAEAYLRGIERRIAAGLNPVVESVASVFISRWDVAVANQVPEHLRGQLGIAVAGRAYKSYRSLLCSPRWQRAYNFGAHAQRLLWASTGTKDPKLPDTHYVKALTAPFTVNTMPDATLLAFADHGEVGDGMSSEQSSAEDVIRQFSESGIDVDALGTDLQNEGAKAFVKSWTELMDIITAKGAELARVG